jgi:hypothetical protein
MGCKGRRPTHINIGEGEAFVIYKSLREYRKLLLQGDDPRLCRGG